MIFVRLLQAVGPFGYRRPHDAIRDRPSPHHIRTQQDGQHNGQGCLEHCM